LNQNIIINLCVKNIKKYKQAIDQYLYKDKNEGKKENIKDIHTYGELKVLVSGFFLLDNNINKLYDRLKANHKETNIVIVNSNIVFGLEHILGIIKIINEEMRLRAHREIKNFDVEFLLRICYTNQILSAFKILNDSKNNDFVCILFSKCISNIEHAYMDLKRHGKENNDLFQISQAKKLHIIDLFFKRDLKEMSMTLINDDLKFQKFLIERAAIALK
jgi:tRNA threonylcarbamoyladenosine modification (KEOPS) complex Cgi121 subunit